MKCFAKVMFVLCAFLVSFQISALEMNPEEVDQDIMFAWDRDENNLYLRIQLSDNLEFMYQYFVTEVLGGQGCQVVCKPKQGKTLYSKEGDELQTVKLTVFVLNSDDPNKITFNAVTTMTYQGLRNEKYVTESQEFKNSGILNSPAIDLTKKPSFISYFEDVHAGVLVFKNSFPPSLLKNIN